MAYNARYLQIWEQVNHLGLNYIISGVNDYIHYQSLHLKLRDFKLKNGENISVLFIILIVRDIHVHSFEIFTLVSEIHENVDLVLEINNILK